MKPRKQVPITKIKDQRFLNSKIQTLGYQLE